MENLRNKALDLPDKPGIYIMLDKSAKVIYVGKAKRLNNRVSSYFRNILNHDAKTIQLISQIHDFDYIVTDTEFEALILENSLIKRHKPKYNILLKDDKGFPFIRLSVNDEYPRFSIVSKQFDDGAKYFGPYKSRVESRQAIDAVCATLKLPTCSRKFPRDIGRARPCLNRHLNKCRAVCAGDVSKEQYRELIYRAEMIFEGKTELILDNLRTRMNEHSEALRFEAAARIRDEIRAVERLNIRQKILSGGMSDADYIAVFTAESKTAFSVLHYFKGSLLESETTILDTPVFADKGELLESFIKQYYDMRSRLPRNIYLSDDMPDLKLLEQWLSDKKETSKVSITVPMRGEKLRIIEMSEENARQKAQSAADKAERVNRTLVDLKKILSLGVKPLRIEAFDISHISGSDMTASMIVYENGYPSKKEYRHFKIKTLSGQDDGAALREVVSRRLERYKNKDEKFLRLPDLILLDGGVQQVRAVKELLDDRGVDIPIFGMVKDDKHKTRGIIAHDGGEVGIVSSPGVFKLVSGIQDEAHRFAITHHKKLRSASGIRSALTEIPGVGATRSKELLKHFKSISVIKNSSFEELCDVVPKNVARNIYDSFNKQ